MAKKRRKSNYRRANKSNLFLTYVLPILILLAIVALAIWAVNKYAQNFRQAPTTQLDCRWCGNICTSYPFKMACTDALPDPGMKCIEVNGLCTAVSENEASIQEDENPEDEVPQDDTSPEGEQVPSDADCTWTTSSNLEETIKLNVYGPYYRTLTSWYGIPYGYCITENDYQFGMNPVLGTWDGAVLVERAEVPSYYNVQNCRLVETYHATSHYLTDGGEYKYWCMRRKPCCDATSNYEYVLTKGHDMTDCANGVITNRFDTLKCV